MKTTPSLPGGISAASAISVDCSAPPVSDAHPFDRATGGEDATPHPVHPPGLDRTLEIAAADRVDVGQGIRRAEHERLRRSHAVHQRARAVEAAGHRGDDMVVTADADDRRSGKSGLRQYLGPHRADRCSTDVDRRGKFRVKPGECEQLRRPFVPPDVVVLGAGGERRVGRGDARETERDPIRHHQYASRTGKGIRPVPTHPQELRQREAELGANSGELKQPVCAQAFGDLRRLGHRPPVEPGDGRRDRPPLAVDQDAALADTGGGDPRDRTAVQRAGDLGQHRERRVEDGVGIVLATGRHARHWRRTRCRRELPSAPHRRRLP